MNLIEEIERVANAPSKDEIDSGLAGCAWRLLNANSYWPRIRTALDAAQEMHDLPEIDSCWSERFSDARRKFREAMG